MIHLSSMLTMREDDSSDRYRRIADEEHDTRLLYDAINEALRAGGHEYYVYQGKAFGAWPASLLSK